MSYKSYRVICFMVRLIGFKMNIKKSGQLARPLFRKTKLYLKNK